MKTRNKWTPGRICTAAGLCLLAVAGIVMGLWLWELRASETNAAAYVQTLRTLLPSPQAAPLEERSNNTMASLSVDGIDFAGLLEMPAFGTSLPVCAHWGSIRRYPCRLSGSIYDGTMQIGATTQPGQYDFYREISPGDLVYFTDMEGSRFSYTVTDIRYERHADQAALQQKEADLTLFIQNIYGFEYILVFCTAGGQ